MSQPATRSRTCFRLRTSRGLRLLGSGFLLLAAVSCGAGAGDEAMPPEPMSKPPSSACAPLSAPLPAPVPDAAGRVVAEPADKIAEIYDQSVLRSFELKLEDKDLAILDANPAAEKYVPGKLVYDGKEYGPVGIRYKGSIGAFVFCVAESTPENPTKIGGAKTCPKLSMKISFNEYDPNGRFFGIKKLVFHSMNHDGSLMKERLGYWLYRQLGVPASRAVHARLSINGKYQGVFMNVEEVDSRFTKAHFGDGDGNLYKEVWPTHVPGLGAPATAEVWGAGLQTNTDKNPSFARALAFSQALMSEGGDARGRALLDWMSIPNVMRFIAVDRTIRADDGPAHFYCLMGGCGNHNFYLYEEQKASRMWLIPWDLDNSFVVTGSLANDGDKFLHVLDEWNDHSVQCKPRPGLVMAGLQQLPPSCDPLWNGLGCYFDREYQTALSELLAGPFSERIVEEKLTVWSAQISAAVADAYAADNRQLTPKDWTDSLAELRARIVVLRAQAARARP
jgi:hypothetical protein